VNPDGQLDATFGQAGVVDANFGSRDERPSAVIALTSGETLVVGIHAEKGIEGTFLAMFDADGKPSSRFGPQGVAVVDPLPGKEFTTRATFDGEGRVILAGYSVTKKMGFVARVLGDGTLDPSFGTAGAAANAAWDINTAWALAIDSDGKVLLGGQSKRDTAIVVRLDANGREDATWGRAGVARGVDHSGDQLYALFPATDHAIIGVGFRGLATDSRTILMKLSPNGTPDTSFGTGGVLLGTAKGSFLSAGTVGAGGAIIGVGMRSGKGDQIDGLAMRFVPR